MTGLGANEPIYVGMYLDVIKNTEADNYWIEQRYGCVTSAPCTSSIKLLGRVQRTLDLTRRERTEPTFQYHPL